MAKRATAKRTPAPELAQIVSNTVTPKAPAASAENDQTKPKASLPTVQVNFRVSEPMARLIAKEAANSSTRAFFARLMRDAGFDVPEADINAHAAVRRRFSE